MSRIHTTALSAIALVLAAGSATAQTGVRETNRQNQNQQSQQTRQENRQPGATPARDATRTLDRDYGQRARYNGPIQLMEAETIIGADIQGPSGDSYGSIEELIVERGSGEIRFAILRVNSVLGFGGDHLALAYHQLQWSPEENEFRTALTEEQIERQASSLPNDWENLQSVGWMNQMDPRRTDERADTRMGDAMRSGSSSELTGRISNITRRIDEDRGEEHVILDILVEDGETKQVVLGPSWYIMGHDSPPFRGQPIVVRGVELDGRFIATSATIDGRNIELRTKDGNGAWDSSDPASGTGTDGRESNRGRTDQPRTDRNQTDRTQTDRTMGDRTREDRTNPADRTTGDRTDGQREAERAALENTERRENYVERDRTEGSTTGNTAGNASSGGRYFLLSHLKDAETQARRIRSGEIESVIVELGSGKIAFVKFDPNENFLGIGDDDILVPWSVVSFGQNRIVNVDADAETIGRTAELPDDLDELRTTQSIAPIYQAYGSQMPDFSPAAQGNQGRDGMNQPMQNRRPGADRPGSNGTDSDRPARPARPNSRP